MSFESKHLNTRWIRSTASKEALLLLVHGRGGRLELMEFFSKRAQKISNLDFLLVEAPHPEFVPEMRKPGFSWYIGKDRSGLDESREKLERMFTELCDFGYANEKIFWLGFSQGGVMGLDFALRSKHLMGGSICISGFCLSHREYPEAFGKYALEQKLLTTHGRRDEIVDFERAKESYDWLLQNGVQLEFLEYDKPHSFDLKKEIPDLIQRLQKWVNT